MPQNNPQYRGNTPDNKNIFIWIIVALVIAFVVGQQFMMARSAGDQDKPLVTDTLLTSEFLQALEQDRVVSVVYDARAYTVTGTYYPAVTAGKTG
ncbi:MAG TPA: cell division protein FtsH, partial [Eggerthellaceae bacterium]|nr:cell division protein FtsH [Eggerthellaceae bacterium]